LVGGGIGIEKKKEIGAPPPNLVPNVSRGVWTENRNTCMVIIDDLSSPK
jgi:hypothetical protein